MTVLITTNYGLLQGVLRERIVTVVYTENDEITRIISVRKATKNERRKYLEGITNRLGEN